MNVYDWGDDSEDTSNVFSGVDEQKSRKSGYSIASSTRPDRINEEIEVVRKKHRLSQSQSNLRKGVGGGIADVVMYPPLSPRQATPLTRSKNKNKVQFGKIRLTNNRNRKNDTEPYYAPVNSPDSSEASRRGREQERRAEHSQSTNSGWFPMPSIGNLISNPSDELSHPKQPGETNSRSTSGRLAEAFSMFADTRLGASPVKVQPKKKEKIRTNPFASSSAESESFGEHEHENENENVQRNMNNKAQSKESYPHGPNSPQASRKNLTRGRPNTYINPFDSTSLSPANSTDYKSNKTHANANTNTITNTNTNSPSRSRRKSRSPSPIYQRPSRDTIRDSGKSEFHNLISCASSPDDELFIDALEMLATSSNPRQLVKVKLLDAHNWTALHIAALSNPPLFLIYAILLVFPEAAKQEDTAGRLPLHLAAGSESNITLLNTLVRFHNEGICTKDHRGLVPLHLTLLRDGDEEISVDVLRILLGQNIGAGDAEIMIGKKSDRRVRDGDMRNGKHLNLQLNEIHGGVLGISRNAIMTKERKQREVLMRLRNKGPKEKLSRGFARDIDDIDSQDGNPHTHEHLSSLWLSERNAIRDPFEKMERREANMFSPEVQHCLRKLANWKKKYNREQTQEVVEEPEPVPIVNPATIPAPPYMRLPVHMAVRRNHKKTKSSNEEHRKNSPLALPPNQNELLRILIHAFPLSLMIRDTQDQTPLMTCLNLVHYPAIHPVDLDMIELLLGIRTSGFRAAPNWLEDADFFQRHQHSIAYGSSNQFNGSLCITSNAAMIPSEQTLPLHIAARESLPLSIIHAIYTCYPGAKYAQDERNCTPLHCALQNVTGRDKLEIEMIRVLTDEKVLRIKNSLHQTIYDLLVYNAEIRKLPRFWKCHSSGASGSSFLPIFEHAVKDQVLNPSGGIDKEKFFSQLSSLPSWLRREACATPAVQILLIEEMTNPINFALISFYGIIFLAHLIAFNSLIDTITVPEADNVQVVTSYFEKIFIVITNIYLSIHGMFHTLAAIRFNTGIFDTASNLWSWVTFVALFSSLFVVFRIGIQERTSGAVDLSDRLLRTMSTIAVGFLWASLLGYFARWWYGVSRFCSSFAKVSCLIYFMWDAINNVFNTLLNVNLTKSYININSTDDDRFVFSTNCSDSVCTSIYTNGVRHSSSRKFGATVSISR